jgi:hypothetical protein
MTLRQLLCEIWKLLRRFFFWQGPIPRTEIEAAISQSGLVVPDDLVDLWEMLGGGEMFESEEIFNPTDVGEDGLVERNLWFRSQGMPEYYLVFHDGGFTSAIRQPSSTIMQLDPSTFIETSAYASLDEWYKLGIRAEFWEKYGLPPAV